MSNSRFRLGAGGGGGDGVALTLSSLPGMGVGGLLTLCIPKLARRSLTFSALVPTLTLSSVGVTVGKLNLENLSTLLFILTSNGWGGSTSTVGEGVLGGEGVTNDWTDITGPLVMDSEGGR